MVHWLHGYARWKIGGCHRASRGIGAAVARAFVSGGGVGGGCRRAAVTPGTPAFVDESAPSSGSLSEWSARSRLVSCDVADAQAVEGFGQMVTAEFGVPDVLVNNAGTVLRQAFEDISVEAWDKLQGRTPGRFTL